MAQDNPTQRPRRFSDIAFETVIGASASVRGEVTGDGAVDLAGSVEGDVTLQGHLRVRRGARLHGSVRVQGLIAEGTIEAPCIVAERIEIGEAARVRANLQARVIAIADGAVFDGSVEMQGGDPAEGPTYFKEQRRPE